MMFLLSKSHSGGFVGNHLSKSVNKVNILMPLDYYSRSESPLRGQSPENGGIRRDLWPCLSCCIPMGMSLSHSGICQRV